MPTFLFDQSAAAKIEVAGPDARSFLHNLCTQDVKNLPVGSGAEAFLTTNKARIIAHVWITHREPDVLWLDAAAGLNEKIFQHLNHYLISEKVELADRTSQFGMLRLVGLESARIAGEVAGPTIASLGSLQAALVPGIGMVRRHCLLGPDGFDFFPAAAAVKSLQDRLLQSGAVVGDASAYEILRIEAGLPAYGIDIDENRLAMEAGRTAQAISYNKGCYLGQETIVMARDRGQLNRQLVGVKLTGNAPLASAARLFRGDQEVGQVTSSVFSPRLGSVIALAYLRRGSWDPGTELNIEPVREGSTAIVSALPF